LETAEIEGSALVADVLGEHVGGAWTRSDWHTPIPECVSSCAGIRTELAFDVEPTEALLDYATGVLNDLAVRAEERGWIIDLDQSSPGLSGVGGWYEISLEADSDVTLTIALDREGRLALSHSSVFNYDPGVLTIDNRCEGTVVLDYWSPFGGDIPTGINDADDSIQVPAGEQGTLSVIPGRAAVLKARGLDYAVEFSAIDPGQEITVQIAGDDCTPNSR
jgi:hypothetical protein